MNDPSPIEEVAAQALSDERPLDSSSAFDHPPLAVPPSQQEARRAEIEAKQELIGSLLTDAGADGLLMLDPANVAWLCGAALHQGITDSSEWPAVFLVATQRWLVAGNADSQRLFDLYLDGLGFQLKEWQWHGGREKLLSELCVNRRMASDRLVSDCIPLGPALRRLRCLLTEPERGRLRDVGKDVVHAVEAVCRSIPAGQTEAETAGQVAHRMLRRGVTPVAVAVAADGRSGRHRRPGISDAVVRQNCVVTATGCRDGVHVSTARTVCLGPKSPTLRQQFDAACRVIAAQAAASRPGLPLTTALEAGRRTAAAPGFEHAWRDLAPGHVTGWQPVERPFGPGAAFNFETGWPIVWQAAVGEALCVDTFVVTADVSVCVTPVEVWPMKRIHVRGQVLDLPDILVRD
jgi:Xaa-Pro aminopeptidase